MPSKRSIGNRGENAAVSFLKRHGLAILDRNYTFHHGEIDIVAKDGNEIVFIEVKTRRTTGFGAPEESVTPLKQSMIRRTAEGYVAEKNLENVSCRFDVIAIQIGEGMAHVTHFRNAF